MMTKVAKLFNIIRIKHMVNKKLKKERAKRKLKIMTNNTKHFNKIFIEYMVVDHRYLHKKNQTFIFNSSQTIDIPKFLNL